MLAPGSVQLPPSIGTSTGVLVGGRSDHIDRAGAKDNKKEPKGEDTIEPLHRGTERGNP